MKKPLPKSLLHPSKISWYLVLSFWKSGRCPSFKSFPLRLLDFVLSKPFSSPRESVFSQLLLCTLPSSHPFPSMQTMALAILTWSYRCSNFNSCFSKMTKPLSALIMMFLSFLLITVKKIKLCRLCSNYFIIISLWPADLGDSWTLLCFP